MLGFSGPGWRLISIANYAGLDSSAFLAGNWVAEWGYLRGPFLLLLGMLTSLISRVAIVGGRLWIGKNLETLIDVGKLYACLK